MTGTITYLIYWFLPATFIHALNNPIYSCVMVVHTFILSSEGRGSWIWGQACEWIPAQPGMHRKVLSWKTETKLTYIGLGSQPLWWWIFDVELNCIYILGKGLVTVLWPPCFFFCLLALSLIVIAHKRNTVRTIFFGFLGGYHMDQTGHIWSFIF